MVKLKFKLLVEVIIKEITKELTEDESMASLKTSIFKCDKPSSKNLHNFANLNISYQLLCITLMRDSFLKDTKRLSIKLVKHIESINREWILAKDDTTMSTLLDNFKNDVHENTLSGDMYDSYVSEVRSVVRSNVV